MIIEYPISIVKIETPNKFILNGLWHGNKNASRVFVMVHGLTGSAFSGCAIAEQIVDKDTAVITFANRGHDMVARLRTNHKDKKKQKLLIAGMTHEVFEDCIDDINGAMKTVRSNGASEIFLIGHSTGCQKSVYWASKSSSRDKQNIKGIILLAPLSDYASTANIYGKTRLAKWVSQATRLINNAQGHKMFTPTELNGYTCDAQRFVSLFSPASIEQSIFPYFDASRDHNILDSVSLPILALFAGNDEYLEFDRTARELVDIFKTRYGVSNAGVISGCGHSFKGKEKDVSRHIKRWISGML